jgi:glycosyltransferase involved in cell wall biosynthesis
MKKRPTLSIIVPVYCAEKYLCDCIDSIMNQTFSDFELILVNDGSTDNSGNICDSYAIRDNRIKVIHKINGGASSARNTGVDAAQGEYIGWVDSDDRIAPNMYATLIRLARHFKADIADCQYLMINGLQTIRSGKDEPVQSGSGDFILKQFFTAQMKPSLCTKIYKRELWKTIRFPEGRIHQDCYLNMKFALMPLVYVRISEPLYYYILRNNSITTTYTSRAMREALYLFDYTISLSEASDNTNISKKYLRQDAVGRFMCRYFDVSVNSNLKNQVVYTKYIRKKLGWSLINHILTSDLPLKTRISYSLLLLNLKGLQGLLHAKFGQKK